MAYNNFNAFARDFNQTWGDFEPADLRVAPEVAYNIYTHGLNQGPRHGLTIGLIPILRRAHIPNLNSVFDGGRIFVCDRDPSRWRIFLNDCFILGGIHSHGEFRLVGMNSVVDDPDAGLVADPGDQPQLNHVRDPQTQFNLKVTQREVIGLNTFGYTGANFAIQNERRFRCARPDLADAATLRAYRHEAERVEGALRAGPVPPDNEHLLADFVLNVLQGPE